MAVGDAHVFPGFLTQELTQLFFPKPPTTFFIWFCRGERRKYAGKKSHLNQGSNSQPADHESDTLTTESPGRFLVSSIDTFVLFMKNKKLTKSRNWMSRELLGLLNHNVQCTIHAFQAFLLAALDQIFFPGHWLLRHGTITKIMVSRETEQLWERNDFSRNNFHQSSEWN